MKGSAAAKREFVDRDGWPLGAPKSSGRLLGPGSPVSKVWRWMAALDRRCTFRDGHAGQRLKRRRARRDLPACRPCYFQHHAHADVVDAAGWP